LGPDPRYAAINEASVVGGVAGRALAAEGPFQTAHDDDRAVPAADEEEVGGVDAADPPAAQQDLAFANPETDTVVKKVELIKQQSVTNWSTTAEAAQSGSEPAYLPYNLDMPGPGEEVIRDYEHQIKHWPAVEVGWGGPNPAFNAPHVPLREKVWWPERKHARDLDEKLNGTGSLFNYDLMYPNDVGLRGRRRLYYEDGEKLVADDDDLTMDPADIPERASPIPAREEPKGRHHAHEGAGPMRRGGRVRRPPSRLGTRATASQVREAAGPSTVILPGRKKGKGKAKV
jgi:hypothetical protein